MKTRIKVVHTADGNTKYIAQYRVYGFWFKMRHYYKHHGVVESISKYFNNYCSINPAERSIDLFLEKKEQEKKEKLANTIKKVSYIKYPD